MVDRRGWCSADITKCSRCSSKSQVFKWCSGTQWMPMENGRDEANLIIANSHLIKLPNWLLSNAPAMLSRKDVNEPLWGIPSDAQMSLLLAASLVGAGRSCQGAQHWWNIWLSAVLSPSVPTIGKTWNGSGSTSKMRVKYCLMQPVLNVLFEVQL